MCALPSSRPLLEMTSCTCEGRMACARTALSSNLTPRISPRADASVCSIVFPFDKGSAQASCARFLSNVEKNAREQDDGAQQGNLLGSHGDSIRRGGRRG